VVKELKMPIYEYRCSQCCHEFEELTFSISGPAPDCPKCSHPDVMKLMSTGTIRPNGVPAGSGGFTPPACKTPRGGG
jgi:putative FmdB family regulatory protein